MLKRISGLMSLCLLSLVLSSNAAYAGVSCQYDPSARRSICTVSAGGGGSTEGRGAPGAGSRSSSGGGGAAPVCSYNGKTIPCTSEGSYWFADHSCYASAVDTPASVASDGTMFTCTTGAVGAGINQSFMVPNAQLPPPPPDPRVLAQQAIRQMGLHAIGVGMAPPPGAGKVGVIGLPTWMWVADPGPSTTGPQTQTASANGYTVTATATLTDITWSMGDGGSVVCHGASTPYNSSYGRRPSPDCGYTYTKSGDYTVTATSHWQVAWSGIGQSGVIPLQFTSTAQVTEAELQAIGQR